jgi:hypothetical protein
MKFTYVYCAVTRTLLSPINKNCVPTNFDLLIHALCSDQKYFFSSIPIDNIPNPMLKMGKLNTRNIWQNNEWDQQYYKQDTNCTTKYLIENKL